MDLPTQEPDSSSAPDVNPNKKRKKRSRVLKKLLADMIPVVAGILIAIFINDVQQRFADERLLKSTLEALTAEFLKNRQNIERLLPKQQTFLDTIRHYIQDPNYNIFDMTQKSNGMGTPEIYSTNWRSSFNNNSIGLMNFETVNLLSQIDSKHQELKDSESYITSMVFGPNMFATGSESISIRKGFELWTQTYMGNEHELIELYKKFEAVVNNHEYQR
jgi:hypothetical protein